MGKNEFEQPDEEPRPPSLGAELGNRQAGHIEKAAEHQVIACQERQGVPIGKFSYFIGGSAMIFPGVWLVLHGHFWGLFVIFLASLVATRPLSLNGGKSSPQGDGGGSTGSES